MAMVAAFFVAAFGAGSTAGQVFVGRRAHGFVLKRRRRNDELMLNEVCSRDERARGCSAAPQQAKKIIKLAACNTLESLHSQAFAARAALPRVQRPQRYV